MKVDHKVEFIGMNELTGLPKEVKADWGHFVINDYLDMFRQWRAQLKWFLDTGRSQDRAYTQRDIDGYEKVIATNCNTTARRFFEVKSQAKEAGKPFKDNLEVVKELKKLGFWRKGDSE